MHDNLRDLGVIYRRSPGAVDPVFYTPGASSPHPSGYDRFSGGEPPGNPGRCNAQKKKQRPRDTGVGGRVIVVVGDKLS